jgi:predicted negative regulator of RcsB-dependent stress response
MQPDSTKESVDFDNLMAWLHYNWKPVAIGAGAVAVLLVGFALHNWNKNQNEAKANAELFAMPSLVGANNKTEVRAENFQKIADEFPNTSVAQRAELIAAGVLFTDGKFAEAEKEFTKFLNADRDNSLQAQAAVGVAASLEAQNKIGEATAKYQELIAKYSGENVVSPGKLTLARLLESQNKGEEALKLYDDLLRNPNPYDPWSAEARERRELLLQKFPSLKSKPAMAAPTVSPNAPVVTPSAPTVSTNKQ